MASCLIVQHVEPECPYAIGEALVSAGVQITLCRIYASEPLPRRMGAFGALVVMGGPMSAISDEGFATRRHEMKLLTEALDLELPTLGVCLGAQLLAAAAGGEVVAGAGGPEVGWAPVRLSAAAAVDPLLSDVSPELTVLHWHSDTYRPPPRAAHLASSDSYVQQAFRVGTRAWGLQFHVELDRVAAVDAFLDAFGEDVAAAGTTCGAIRAATPGALSALSVSRRQVFSRFAALVATGRALVGNGRVDALE